MLQSKFGTLGVSLGLGQCGNAIAEVLMLQCKWNFVIVLLINISVMQAILLYCQHLHKSVLLPFPSGTSDIFVLNCFIVLKNVIVHVCDTGRMFHYIDIQDICGFLQYFSVPDNLWRLAELFLATQVIAAPISLLAFCMDSDTPCITHY